jgi:outer membrane lipoprotein-sorting protein
MQMKKTWLLTALLCIAFQAAHAQTADEILNKYFEATGGLNQWKALKSLKMEGDMTMQQGSFAITIFRKAPNKFKVLLNVMGQELIPQAYDGETGWMVNPFAGSSTPEKMTEEQVKALKGQADFEDPIIDYKTKGYEATFEGMADVEGTSCQVVKLVRNKGVIGLEESASYYFDPATGLQVMMKQSNADTGGQEVEIYLSDYQDAGNGLLMPFIMDTRLQGQSLQKIVFKKMGVNAEIADSEFAFPAPPAVN